MSGNVLRLCWPLFLGIFILTLGNGLQGTLSGWRADAEGFSIATIGWIMVGYPIGILIGAYIAPQIVKQSGHIRAYAVFATIASTAILIQIVFIDSSVWFFTRIMSGICIAGVNIIVESWLNAKADNANRGKVFSIFMAVIFLGLSLGQGLLMLDDPMGYSLFILTSVLLSISLIPVLIPSIDAPEIEHNEPLGIATLYRVSTSGVFTIALSAVAVSAFFSMGAVFAVKAGLSVTETAIFMSVFIAFGALAQWPLGWISDKVDRRWVIFYSACVVTAVCIIMNVIETSYTSYLFMSAFIGSSMLPLYSLGVAHANDRLDPKQMMGASSTINMLFGVFAMFGPLAMAYSLELFNLSGFYALIGVMHLLLAVVILKMIFTKEAADEEDQTQFQVMPHRPGAVLMEVIAEEAMESQLESGDVDDSIEK
ncbi:MAG: MFS transporter [PS1 clade bacterium]